MTAPVPGARARSAGGLAALTLLALRRERNRLRRLLRRPGWLLLYGVLAAGVGFVLLQAPSDTPSPASPVGGISGGLAAAWILVASWMRLWGATTRSPFVVAQADASLLLPSPISSRQILLFQLVRSAVRNVVAQLPFLALWVMILRRLGAPLSGSDVLGFYLFMVLLGLWGDGLHAAGWLALERVPSARSALARRGVRLFLLAGAFLTLAWLASPVPGDLSGGGTSGIGALAGRLVERARILAVIPPLSWPAGLLEAAFDQGPWEAAALLGSVATIAVFWATALALAEGYYEALVLQGEQDARLHQAAASWNVDVQGAAVELLAVARRLRRIPRLPVRGRGAWAIFWQQINRWLRLELGSWWVNLLGLGLLGGLLGLLVRGSVAPFLLWLAPAGLALLSAPWGYLSEELRRPYIYLIPDSALNRLVAASLISALDIFVSFGLMLAIACGVAGAAWRPLAGGLVLLLAVAWVAQASLALGSVVVPAWLGRPTRTVVQSLLSVLGLLPGALVRVAAEAAGVGSLAAAALAFLAALATGLGLFAAAAALFNRSEMAG